MLFRNLRAVEESTVSGVVSEYTGSLFWGRSLSRSSNSTPKFKVMGDAARAIEDAAGGNACWTCSVEAGDCGLVESIEGGWNADHGCFAVLSVGDEAMESKTESGKTSHQWYLTKWKVR
jgi:hypothetical protein